MPGKIKVNFKMPPETAAEKMYRKHQELRKKSGLPDPSHYKNLAAQKQKEIDALRNEEAEQLDEMPESSMKTRDVHAHLKKSGWALKRTGGGHDVYAHPKSKEHIAVPRHKQLKAPLIRGIMKASRVSEETEIEEQLEKKGRFVSGPPKKTFKASTIVSPIREAKDPREYDYEGDMAMSQLRSMIFNAEDMMELMEENTNLPEWVQSKITLAEDYISTAANYLRGELSESVKLNEGRPSQRHPLEGHEYHKKTNAELEYIAKDAHKAAEAMKSHNTTAENKYRDQANDSATVRYFRQKSGMPDWYKKKYGHVKEEVEQIDIEESAKETAQKAINLADKLRKKDPEKSKMYRNLGIKASQRSNNPTGVKSGQPHGSGNKALRKQGIEPVPSSMSSSKMRGYFEEVEQLDEVGDTKKGQKLLRMINKRAVDRLVSKKADKDPAYAKKAMQTHLAADERLKEDVEYLEEKNVPTSPEKWAQAKAQAKQKFDVYPSAYANGWAAKKYKEMGGGWKSVNEDTDEPSAAARTLSRKAQIVKAAAKGKKNEQEEASDKFQKDPELSSDMQKT